MNLFLLSILTTSTLILKLEPARPFDGTSLEGWKTSPDAGSNCWITGEPTLDPSNDTTLIIKGKEGALINVVTAHGEGANLFSEPTWGDSHIVLEVMVPKGSNSGIYVGGEYEVQVFDSFGVKEPGPGDMGAIFGASPPKVNASLAPGEWQKFEIDFRAPKFNENGEKTAAAKFVSVKLNGQILHENVEMPEPTPGGLTGQESARGPLMFQGDHGVVAYRNIIITTLSE